MNTSRHGNETTLVSELRAGRSVTYFTRGTSMRPLLRTAETHVHICPVEERPPQELDIVLYLRVNGQQVLHRLIRQEGEICYIRGDNTYGLEPVRREQIVGVVDQIWRKGAYIHVDTDRRYRRYVRRRLWNYPLRCAVHYPYMWARAAARRLLKRRARAE